MGTPGRPTKYKDEAEILAIAEKFFKERDRKKEPYTITGLALALDTDRKSLINWGNDERFFHTIKKIKAIVEDHVERRVAMGEIPAAVGIFMLKNFGWTDRTEQKIEHSGDVSLGSAFDKLKDNK